MSAETPEHPLVRAISELYDVFDGYVIQNPEPCPTCYSAEEVRYIGRRIRTVPLRDLTLDDIGHFYGDGLLTWGDADDFRYLLPRLMELFAAWHTGVPAIEPDDSIALLQLKLDPETALRRFTHDRWTGALDPQIAIHWTRDNRWGLDLDPETAFRRFTDARWEAWPEQEHAAVDRFLWELWRAYLGTTEGSPLPVGHMLEEALPAAVLQLVDDPRPFLEFWRVAGPIAARHLSWFIAMEQFDTLFWQSIYEGDPSREPNQLTVAMWLGEAATTELLERTARDPANAVFAWEVVLALESLERGRDALKFRRGSWIPDEVSELRARGLGVSLPPKRPDQG